MDSKENIITRIAGIIIENEKILLVKGKRYEYFRTPGGKTEERETNEECLKRELKEEIGVDLIEGKFFKEYNGYSFFHPTKKIKQIVYVCKINGKIIPDMEIESFIWYSKDDFYNKRYPIFPVQEEKIFVDLIKNNIW